MLIISTLISSVAGFLVAVVLVVTNKGGMLQNKLIYGILSFLVNVIRSFPFIILVVFILPVTKVIVGTSIGVKAAIVPLVVAATAFIAKIIENSLQEVDEDLIEAMKSFGLSDAQVIFNVMFSEALPSIVSGIILATIAILGSTAMAGAVGAGGIGSVALTYGYQSFNKQVMWLTVIILIILVQVIQFIGNLVYRRMKP
ncbi:methionine ABC transporter permease [Dehalobacterium formicoaceticum]|uniref:ABC transporter permease n=1 Tax=Dehalobacterium formicoaceticum TaxID=51515 RepID=A0ABT1Y4E5_9FIRM|nr:methionine ABC transporter permease [Dehalobacterium formicoaceticum]MCR6545750.1 ABC transporter permease [Dehalobacterium formicoaceticum]